MINRIEFDFRSQDDSPDPVMMNRILRFEPGAVEETQEPIEVAPPTQLESVSAVHKICLPESYVASYAYPLIVWFHDEGADEQEIDSILPRISERNYLGVALRGNMVRSLKFGWSNTPERLAQTTAELDELIDGLQQEFRIHRDRIYLAGFGTGGTLAWEILLSQPSRWAGAICLSGRFPKIAHPLAMFRELQKRRLLLSSGWDRPASQVTELVNAGRLMYSAGMQVGTRMYERAVTAPTDRMLRDIDHWVMDSIATAIHA